MKHGIEELDRGQLDLMWNFLRFDCGQKSDIPTLKEHLDMLRQAMIQKTGGQEKHKDSHDVSFNDVGTIINCIVIETMQLYLSGDLDKLEKLKPCPFCGGAAELEGKYDIMGQKVQAYVRGD